MSISSISGSSAASYSSPITSPGAASVGSAAVGGSGEAALVANLGVDSSGVSAAIQSLSSALGSIINTMV